MPANLPPDDLFSPLARSESVITVSELNRQVRARVEAGFPLLWVRGELSNVVRAASGHWYFSLKDDAAQVRCVMFRQRASTLTFTPEAGQQVELRALPSLYEPRGDFQLGVESMRRAGLGALFEAYEKLKAKLNRAGLFDNARKKALPRFPRAIGIVSSLHAAALQDVLTTLRRRAPTLRIIIYPTAVQGRDAQQDITAAIDAVRRRVEVDVLVICRGGGSIEDLWAFNDEAVARAIVRLQDETPIAVVSGVGHETDFTICDFVADVRAPTPTAAAELASPDGAAIATALRNAREALRRALRRKLSALQQGLDHASRALISPTARVLRERDRVALTRARMRHALARAYQRAAHEVALSRQRVLAARPTVAARRSDVLRARRALRDTWQRQHTARAEAYRLVATSLVMLDPARVLERGYSIVEIAGEIVRRADQTQIGETLTVRLARGRLAARITDKS